jgi:hypothetical protein
MTWPEPPTGYAEDRDFLKVLYEAKVEEESARRQAEHESEGDLEVALSKSVHDARLEVAKTAIDRGHKGAEFVRNAAAAIVTLYTGLLGVTFATTNDATPFPPRGLAPAFFLGLALVCASAYAALLTRAPQIDAPAPHSQLSVFQERRLYAFVEWVSKIALARAYFLHVAVVSLGLGVILLPAPFLAIENWVVLVIAALGLVLTVTLPQLTTGRARGRTGERRVSRSLPS